MNPLEQLHITIDYNDWDITDEGLINKAFQDVNKALEEAGDVVTLHFSELERVAFAFSKNPKQKLSYKVAGSRTLEDGTEVPFQWPDPNTLTQEDLQYLYKRFNEAKNIFAKTEFGLVLHYAGYIKKNEDIFKLVQLLFQLVQTYVTKAMAEENGKFYTFHYRGVLAHALHIAQKRKNEDDIKKLFHELIQFTFQMHQQWDVKSKYSLRTAVDLTAFAVEYFKDFVEVGDVEKILQKNWEIAKNLEETNKGGAMGIADISIKLCKKLKKDYNDWLYFKATQYEKLAVDAGEKNNLAAVSFIEKAMEMYKGLKDIKNLKRLQSQYQQLRVDFAPGKISEELPQDDVQRIMELIKNEVQAASQETIIQTILLTPMIMPLEKIKQLSFDASKQSIMMQLIPVSIKDKFGNTIAQFSTEEEKERFSLLRTYEFHFQFALQTLIQYFFEALRTNKISAKSVLEFLNKTWMGQPGTRRSNGKDYSINYLNLVAPGIKALFNEMQQWKTIQGYKPNFIVTIDTLVLKAEYFIREFCSFLGIHTFKVNSKLPGIIMEKVLDDLLVDLTGKLTVDDHYFLKFVLTEKVGYNLRNKVAHALLDSDEYGLDYAILAFITILKLSNYQFKLTSKK